MFAFYFLLCYKINFDGGDLSSDAGLLLIKEFISKLGIDTLLEKAFKTNAPVFKSVLEKDALASQPTVSRFFNRMDEDTLNQFLAIARVLRRKIYSIQMPQAVILDLDSCTGTVDLLQSLLDEYLNAYISHQNISSNFTASEG